MVSQLQRFRLSPQQRSLWQQQKDAFRACCVVSIAGQLDVTLLRDAVQTIVSRHEILHTVYQHIPGMKVPVQSIANVDSMQWYSIDWREFSQHVQESNIDKLVRDEIAHTPATEQEPALRVFLIALQECQYILLLSLPMLSSDSETFKKLMQEISIAYDPHGSTRDLAENVIQYTQFSEWQHELLESDEAQQGKDYWAKQHRTVPPGLVLPGETSLSAINTTEMPHVFALQLPGLAAHIDAISQQYKIAIDVFLLGIWQTLLWRLTGVRDIVIHTAFSGRKHEELLNTLGLCTKSLPIHSRFTINTSFCDIGNQLGQIVTAANTWQEYFMEEVSASTSAEHISELPIRFEFEEWPVCYHASGVTFSVQQHYASFDTYKIKLSCIRRGDDLVVKFFSHPALFPYAVIQRLAGQFHTLLLGVATNPEISINNVDILSACERQQLLIDLNQTHVKYPEHCSIQQLFEEQVVCTPDNIAVVFEGHFLKYAELNARANQLAHYLQSLGVGPDVLVAICLERSLAMVIGVLGILKAGGAYVPVDATYPQSRITSLLEDIQARVLITCEQFSARMPTSTTWLVCLDTDWDVIAQHSAVNPGRELFPEHLAYVIYTSGSTGRPKGIMVPQRGLVNYLSWCTKAYEVMEGQGSLVHSSISFDLTITSLFAPLIAGQMTTLLPEDQGVEVLANALRRGADFSLIKITPSHLVALNQLLPADEIAGRTRVLVIGGEALYCEKLANWRRYSSTTRLINEYGPTETVVGCCVYEIPADGEETELVGVAAIGKPIANTQLYILDAYLQPVPIGVTGELYVGGDGLARGYLHCPDLTAQSFIPHPFSLQPGSRLYRTGDLACYRPDENIEYLGRLDTQVKVRGYRIEPGEIEAVLDQHSGVQEAVVMTREEGPDDKRLLAYIVPHGVRAQALRQLLRLEKQGLLADHTLYELPNGMVIIQHTKSETQLIYHEIFENQVYSGHGITFPDEACIFDVGANIGLFSIYASQQCKNATIYAFEPIPAISDIMHLNTKIYAVNATIFNYGLSCRSENAVFTYYPHCSVLSGLFADGAEEYDVVKTYLLRQQELEAGKANIVGEELDEMLAERLTTQQFTCQLKTISEVMREQQIEHIDILKIDVEKSELDVLSGIQEQDWQKIEQIIIEVHDTHNRLEHIVSLLEMHGYALTIVEDEMFKGSGLYNVYAMSSSVRRGSHSKQSGQSAQTEVGWSNARLLTEHIQEFVRERLPAYMLPSAIMLLDMLPLTSNGKVDRSALPLFEHDRNALKKNLVAPRTPVEHTLVALWTEILGLGYMSVSVQDNFFGLGGHSMLATQLISRVRATLQVEVPLGIFFETPTIEVLAKHIEKAQRAQKGVHVPPIVPLAREGAFPLSFAQQRLWFLDQLEPDSTVYLNPAAQRLCGVIDVMVLEWSMQALVQRHESLRTIFLEQENEPVQIIQSADTFSFPLVDLQGLMREEREHEMRRLAEQEARQPAHLGRGPLLRTFLLRLDGKEHVLLLTMHHIITDGWSMDVFARELTMLYQAKRHGQPSPLSPLSIQYADFALWQRQWLQGEVLATQLSYWRRKLGGAHLLELSTDHPRPAAQSSYGATCSFVLATELSSALTTLSQQEGVTMFMALLTAFQILLHHYTGQTDIVVGTDVANRNRLETESLIGFFVNQLVLRTDLSGNPTFRELLKHVKNTVQEAYIHQDLPFEKLVEVLKPQRSSQQVPFFRVKINFQTAPAEPFALLGLQDSPVEVGIVSARHDLTLSLLETANGLAGSITYNADLFPISTIERLIDYFKAVLKSVVVDPDIKLDAVEIITREEREQQRMEKKARFNAFKGIKPGSVSLQQDIVRGNN